MVKVLVICAGLIARLVVAYLFGRIIQLGVTGGLFQPARLRARQRRQVALARAQAQVISDGIHVKRMLDAGAFAAHQEMLRVAQEIAKQRSARR